jgi:4-hydroxy-3-methylbut-2-enyl diphosphate reductase
MNRSAVREFHAPGVSVPRGELLVPTQVGDPARGPLMCPAGPLIGGSLLRKGWRAAAAPVPVLDDLGGDLGGGAAVYLVTCAQRGGQTAALAAAASPDDRRAAAAASAAVEEWAAVAGTRRLLTAGRPWCAGALNALATARAAVSEQAGRARAGGAQAGRTVHVCGELAAPPEAAEELARAGVVTTATLDGIPQGDIVIFPAHGQPPAVRAEAVARGLAVVDATCPFVAHAQDQAARLAERGDDVVLIGHPGQRTAAAITGCAQRAAVVESAGGTATLQVTDARRVSYLLQPGIPVEWSGPVTGALRSRFPAARGPNPDGFCYAPSDRAQTIKAIAADCELMLVLGDADSPDARMLSALARDGGAKTQVIAAAGDLTPAMLAGVSALGLAESASAPSSLAGQVTTALSGLGPLSVVRRQVSSQITEEQPSQPAPI